MSKKVVLTATRHGKVIRRKGIFQLGEDGYLRMPSGKLVINSEACKKAGVDPNEISKILSKKLLAEYREFLVKPGMNAEGLELVSEAQERLKEERAAREKVRLYWGYYGFRIMGQVPKDVWSIVKPHARYYDSEFADDMDDFNVGRGDLGWYVTAGVVDALIGTGIKVVYLRNHVEHPIQSSIDLTATHERIILQEEKAREKAEATEAEIKKHHDVIWSAATKSSDIPTSEECDEIMKLDRFSLTGFRPQNIYGSGFWFHQDEQNLYVVRNNGGDGDMWSMNNYGTQGGGAICYRVARTAEIDNSVNYLRSNVKD